MIRVSIYYPNTTASKFNLEYFLTQHVPLVEGRLRPVGLERVEIDEGIATPKPDDPVPFSVVEHLVFNNFEEMQTALGENSEMLMADVPNFTNVEPMVQINRVV